MIKVETKNNNKYIYNIKDNVVLSTAEIVPFKDSDIDEFFEMLIDSEIKLIKEFDDSDLNGCSNECIIKKHPDSFNDILEVKRKTTNKKAVYIELIQSEKNGTHAGSEIVDYLKKNYDCIFLYSTMGAETYWLNKQNFELFYDGYAYFIK